MDLSRIGLSAASLASPVPAKRCPVDAIGLLTACRVMWEKGGQLVALWGCDDRDRDRGFAVNVVLQDADGLVLLEHALPSSESTYPDLAVVFPAANRMQRAAFDLVGIASEADDQRPWLWQASWPIDQFPLRRDFVASPKWQPGEEEYAFVRVEGDGVHEIPVGPVHAGIIEPGHFRFQVVGEKVLRLEERLGFVHKGIEKRFESMPAATGHRLAGRVSGDSTVAYAWAYAQALEAIGDTEPPPRAQWLRALARERERIANHLGDLGYLGNDGGFAFGLAQFSRLKEHVLRTNLVAFGHRLAMDFVAPGGVAHDLAPAGAAAIVDECAMLEREIATLKDIYAICAATFPSRPTMCLPCNRRRPRRETSRRAWPCASTSSPNRCGSSALSSTPCLPATLPHSSPSRRRFARAWAMSKAGAGRCWSRSNADPTERYDGAIRMIRRGRTGRCSSTR